MNTIMRTLSLDCPYLMGKSYASYRANTFKQQGFSLIELLVTVAVLAIMLTMAAPSLLQIYIGNALTGQANNMLATLNFARSEAIHRNAPVRLCRANAEDSTACAGTVGSWRYWLVVSSTGEVLQRGSLPLIGNIAQVSNVTNDNLLFGADGLARANSILLSNQYLQIQSDSLSDNNTRCVRLGAGSRLSVEQVTGNCS